LRALFLRRTTPQLAELIQEAQGMFCTPTLGAKFCQKDGLYQRATFQFPKFKFEEDEYGRITRFEIIPGSKGALLVFGHMKEENTKFDYGGFQFPHIRWDELCNFTETQYLFMMSRNRSKKDPNDPRYYIPPNVRSTGNPVGEGRGWVKRRFIEPMDVEEIAWFGRRDGQDKRVAAGSKRAKTRVFIPGDRKENDYLDDEYEDTLEQLDTEMYRALAKGDWSDYDSDNQLILSAWLEIALAGVDIVPCDVQFRGQRALGVDPAYTGADKSVICNGFENKLKKIWSYPQTQGQDLAWLVDQECITYPNIRIVCVDAVGIGVSACDFLESGGKELILQMPGMKNFPVDINNRASIIYRCSHKDPAWEEKYRGGHKFLNFRSQVYWKLREDMQSGKIDLSELVVKATYENRDISQADRSYKKNEIAAEKEMQKASFGGNLNLLKEELLAIRYFYNDQGAIYIQSKAEMKKAENLGRSPDHSDAFAYWNWGRDREAQANVESATEQHPADYVTKKASRGAMEDADYVTCL
jgi:hypothetical protein